MKLFELNTHHTFLNIYPVISILNSCSIDIVLENGDKKLLGIYTEGHTAVIKNLEPGKLVVRATSFTANKTNEETQEEVIVVEDAIKYGGGKAKKGFVFDSSPWLFVTTGDRLYIWNRETQTSKIEYNLDPDEILPCWAGSSYFLFKSLGDYSIFDIQSGQIIFSYNKHIYVNDRIVMYGDFGDVHVYDYHTQQEILVLKDQYSFDLAKSRLFYIQDKKVYFLNTSSTFKKQIEDIEELSDGKYQLHKQYLLSYNLVKGRKTYHLYDLSLPLKKIDCYSFETDNYVGEFFEHEMFGLQGIKEQLNRACDEIRKAQISYRDVEISATISYYNLYKFSFTYENHKRLLNLYFQDVKASKKSRISQAYIAKLEKDQEAVSIRDVAFECENVTTATTQTLEEPVYNKEFGTLLCHSKSTQYAVFQKDDGLTLLCPNIEKPSAILQDVYMPCLYQNAYFTSDGKSVVMVKGNDSTICNFEDLSETSFYVEGFVTARQEGFNGYKPELVFLHSSFAQPRWHDPISLNYVLPEDMSYHIFKSSDGCFEANINFRTVLINYLTGEEVSSKEYMEFEKLYTLREDASDDEKKEVLALRPKLLEQYGEEKITERWRKYYTSHMDCLLSVNLTQDEKKARVDTAIKRELDAFLTTRKNITPIIFDQLGYVVYRNTKTGKENTILIGSHVWFLNYVSFSSDSRYLAFGAKMTQYEFRSSMSGVYVLYDLQEKREVLRYDDNNTPADRNLSAVWSAVFSKKMDSAFYDSNPNSYIVHNKEGVFSTELVARRSLLCFSPTGDYIAFSNQGYIDYQHHPDRWGHQPSGHIFIHKVASPQETLCTFDDFAEGIRGVSVSAGSVASAAFSCDERRLLAVGSDGTVVVRNLHLSL